MNSTKRHLPLQKYIIFSAILLGLLGGFGIGAHLVYFLAFGLPPGKSFLGMVQVHGHLQLVGWTGLFIIGISFFKLPRLMSDRTISSHLVNAVFFCLITGLLLRSFAQILIFYRPDQSLLRYSVTLGSLLESLGILVYFAAIFRRAVGYRAQPGAIAAAGIKPFLIVSLLGWFFFALLNAASGILFSLTPTLFVSPAWNNIANETYIYGVLLPTCFAFSISTFPIFLRLRAPTWPVARVAVTYAVGVLLNILGLITELLGQSGVGSNLLNIGVIIRAVAVFWLIFELDLLRRHRPWFKKFREQYDRDSRPPRRHAGDYGQFGNFEWLIYTAYLWLFLGALSEVAALFSSAAPSPSIVRHFYLLGFVTHLILGMAVRIIPGFIGKNRVAYPNLVRLSFALILAAAIGRTLHVLVPTYGNILTRCAYGFSGVFAMLAIATLGLNLFATIKR